VNESADAPLAPINNSPIPAATDTEKEAFFDGKFTVPPNIYHPQIPSVERSREPSFFWTSATLNLLLTGGGDTGGEGVVHERDRSIKEDKKCGEPAGGPSSPTKRRFE
jgi:hypothetical protein